jgi:hypothetical protein
MTAAKRASSRRVGSSAATLDLDKAAPSHDERRSLWNESVSVSICIAAGR